MPPSDLPVSAPAQGPVRGGLHRIRRFYDAVPLPVKALLLIALCVIFVPGAAILIAALLIYAPYAVWKGRRDGWATLAVTVWGLALVSGLAHGAAGPRYALFALPVVTGLVAHLGAMRWFAPCRTAAWVVLLALLPGIATFRLFGDGKSFIGPGLAWLLACVVLGWRLAKAWQDSRQASRPQQVRGGSQAGAGWMPGQPAGNGRARRDLPPGQRGRSARRPGRPRERGPRGLARGSLRPGEQGGRSRPGSRPRAPITGPSTSRQPSGR